MFLFTRSYPYHPIYVNDVLPVKLFFQSIGPTFVVLDFTSPKLLDSDKIIKLRSLNKMKKTINNIQACAFYTLAMSSRCAIDEKFSFKVQQDSLIGTCSSFIIIDLDSASGYLSTGCPKLLFISLLNDF